MINSREQIAENILDFIHETKQRDISAVVSYCIGFYGCINKDIWCVIRAFIDSDVIYFSRTDEP